MGIKVCLLWCLLLLLGLCSAEQDVATFQVKDATGHFCLVLQANITGTIKYQDKNGNTRDSTFSIPALPPTNVTDASFCGTSSEMLQIDFVPDGIKHNETESNHSWFLTLQFNSTEQKDRYSLIDYSLDVMFFDIQNASSQYNGTYIYKKAPSFKPEWSASIDKSNKSNAFGCSQNALSLTNDSILNFKMLKVIAFASLEKADFTNVETEPCLLDIRTSDLIPIIVGACLAGLVIIVLVAYLIGRARAKRQGYASV